MIEQVKIALTSDVPVNHGKVIPVKGEVIALFNVDGKFYAIDNACPHRGGPLGEGDLEGCVVTCPWHGWNFDVTTGCSHDIPDEKIKTYSCRIEGETVWVEL